MSTPDPIEGRFQFSAHVHSYLQSQIALADAKAAVISGIAGALFVAYREITDDWRFVEWDAVSVLRGVLQVPFLLLVLMAVVHGYAALAPRMPDPFRHGPKWLEKLHGRLERLAREQGGSIDLVGGGGLVRWPELANRSRYVTTEAYARQVASSASEDLAADLAEHCAILARIVAEKFQHVRLALNYVVVAGLLAATLSLLGQVGRQ
jgi:hypothetical protein